jgi:hypothetical protein
MSDELDIWMRVRKTAAKRVGVSFDEYTRREAAGLKYCTACKDWHPLADFGVDASRHGGYAAACKKARKVRYTATYKSKRREVQHAG